MNHLMKALTVSISATITSTMAFASDSAQTDIGTLTVEDFAPHVKTPGYSPHAGRHFPTRVLWGDTHLHTAISLDAAAAGCTLGPEQAYRYARGEEVTTSSGQQAQLSRPLDFLVVTDHAEAFGSVPAIIKGDPRLLANPQIARWQGMIKEGGQSGFNAALEMVRAAGDPATMPKEFKDPDFIRNVWEQYVGIAEKFNDPGKFTAFIGYEWTSMPGGSNLHRNVIFRDGADKALKTVPFSSLDSQNVEDLWKVLGGYEEKTGGKVLAIPHNGNVSGGLMFALTDFMGNPLTRKYAEERSRWEPLIEVTQQKGDSETHPFLSPSDEFAAYERWDKMNLNGVKKHEDKWFEFEYVRSALKNGLVLEDKLGANPFKFGMVGGTDSHSTISAVEEDDFIGKAPPYEPNPTRWSHDFTKLGDTAVKAWELGASGYVGVWSEQNTRESIWDAMKRKEVYATTGPRMTVRFFGGWTFEAKHAASRNVGATGYSNGVPMGGDLSAAPKAGESPSFLVAALKDPIGGNLDRIQIVKGWLDAKGAVQEKVYDVAWSGGRKKGKNGKLAPVGNTVDVPNATWTNTIGAPELITVWKDPSFDPKQRAFYYARVIEIPTPRWTAYDAKRFGVKMTPDVPMVTQERAYTSPIWYTPGA